jgi:hypothetical protein
VHSQALSLSRTQNRSAASDGGTHGVTELALRGLRSTLHEEPYPGQVHAINEAVVSQVHPK